MKKKELRTQFYRYRMERGLSREHFMKKYSVKEQTVKNWETGKHAPNPERCLEIAYELDAFLMDVLDENGNREYFNIYSGFTVDEPFGIEISF